MLMKKKLIFIKFNNFNLKNHRKPAYLTPNKVYKIIIILNHLKMFLGSQ